MGFIWVEDKENDDKSKLELQKLIDASNIKHMNTNSGLLRDIKKLKRKVRAKDGFEIDEFEEIKKELGILKEKEEKGETKTQKQLRLSREQYTADMDELKKSINKKDKQNEKNVIKTKIMDCLNSVGVLDVLKKSARKLIQSDASMEGGKVVVGNKSVKKYIKQWAESEVGKNFIGAGHNSGGSSKGNKSKGEETVSNVFDPKSPDYNLTKQIQFKKSNPKKYEKYKAKFK